MSQMCNGAELMGAVGALAPTVFLPRPEIIYISVPLFLPRPEVVLTLAPMLFSPVRRQWLSCYVTIVYIRFLSKKNIRIIGTIIFFAIFLAHTLYIFFSSKITSLFLFYSSKKVTFFTQIRTLLLHSTYDWYTYFFTPYSSVPVDIHSYFIFS